MMEWLTEIRDNRTLERLGQVSDYDRLELVPRFNAVGSWALTLPSVSAAAEMLGWDAGIVVTADGDEVLSGPVGRLERVWEDGADRLEASGPDDTVWLMRRLAYPEAPALTTDTDAHDVRTGVGSTVLRAYVDANAGPGADSTRRVPGLTIGSDPLLGSTVTGRGRFQALDVLLAELALAAGGLGYTVVQDEGDLVFDVYEPADLTSLVVFSREFGNVRAYTYAEEAPAANFIVVGGSGEDENRVFGVGGDSASIDRYGRIEAFRDRRDTGDDVEIQQSLDEQLAEDAGRSSIALTPVDTGAFAFLTDYGVGDSVRVMVDGQPIDDVVREVTVVLDENGETVTPVVGTPNERDPRALRLFSDMARLERRLADLERRQ